LFLVKNLSAAVEVPSTAFKSAKPILTSPIAEAFTTEKSTYVLPTLVLEKVSTPLVVPTSAQPALPDPSSATYCFRVSSVVSKNN
jgi:hypothetical protein